MNHVHMRLDVRDMFRLSFCFSLRLGFDKVGGMD